MAIVVLFEMYECELEHSYKISSLSCFGFQFELRFAGKQSVPNFITRILDDNVLYDMLPNFSR